MHVNNSPKKLRGLQHKWEKGLDGIFLAERRTAIV